MSKKRPLSERENVYWSHGLAPIDVQLVIKCGNLDRQGMKRYIKDLRKEGIYYRHDIDAKEIVVAFADKKMRDAHEVFLKLSAKKAKKLIK